MMAGHGARRLTFMPVGGPKLPGTAIPTHYCVVCPACGWRAPDDGTVLVCPGVHEPALLQADYQRAPFTIDDDQPGLYRYRRWLPVRRQLPGATTTGVFQSTRLGRFLGLRRLWVAFNGHWPERSCETETGTFKDLEASIVLSRLPDDCAALVVPSAGNTAAAFAALASKHQVPCVVVVPARGLRKIVLRRSLASWVKVIALEDADYADAITFAETLCQELGGVLEGGTKNIARRAGLSTVFLAAMEKLERMPDFYFQGVGSGAGAIAVHEAARRWSGAETGSAATAPQPPRLPRLPRLMLCQNAEHAPLYDRWRREVYGGQAPAEEVLGYEAASRCFADELTNRLPPYALRGGVRDCLVESGGDMCIADRRAAGEASQLFRDLEGIDVEPAAAVALACLTEAVATRRVAADDLVLLNITGGGRQRLARETNLSSATSVRYVPSHEWGASLASASLVRACTGS
jgi:cysteate synthase